MELFKHQIQAIQACISSKCKLVIRLPGSGKTYIKCALFEHFIRENKCNILFIAPSNLIPQYIVSFGEYGINDINIYNETREIQRKINIVSYDTLRIYSKDFTKRNWDIVIIDEFHRTKNFKSKTNKSIWEIRKKTDRFYAFTGTPFQNSAYEFFELISLVKGKQITRKLETTLEYKHPRKKTFFRKIIEFLSNKHKRLNQGIILGIKEKALFKELVCDLVDYIPPANYRNECKIPAYFIEDKLIELTKAEVISYKKELATTKNRNNVAFFSDNLIDSKLNSRFLNLSKLRGLLLSNNNLPSSKMLAAVKELNELSKEKDRKVLVFSNFVESGLKILSKQLKDLSIGHYLYYGDTSKKSRQKILEGFNNEGNNIILLSQVGFEGLDIPIATDIIILDPHFNPERDFQIISRALRAFSKNKQIRILRFISTSTSLKNGTIDQSILKISNRKTFINKKIEELLSPSSTL